MFPFQQANTPDSIVAAPVSARQDTVTDALKKKTAAKSAADTIAVHVKPKPVTQAIPVAPISVATPKPADSIQPADTTLVAEVPAVSLFTGHALKPDEQVPAEKSNPYPGWFSFLLLGCIIVIAYLRAAYPKRFIEFFRSVLDMRFASQIVREEKVLSQRVSVFLTFIFLLSSTTFLYIVSGYFNMEVFTDTGITLFLKIGVCIFLLFLFRVVITWLTGFIFKAGNEFSFYTFHIFLFNKALGLALIPVLICLLYASPLPGSIFIYTGLSLFAITYLARLIRGLNIGFAKQGFNKFYLFFYFCTLEILPAVVLAKIVFKNAAY